MYNSIYFMRNLKNKFFIIDFDSTFVKTEGLEELASIVLRDKPGKEKILNKIKQITNLGMEGKMPFDQSLQQRIILLKANKSDIEKTIKQLKKKISSSILRNKSFFKKYRNNIYIISGGFKEFIIPIVEKFGISQSHILANSFIINKNGQISGVDQNNPLSQSGGKIKAVKSLNLKGDIYIIGDGYTDYEVKKMGAAKRFVAFTENVKREIVLQSADKIAPSFDEFLYSHKLPMTISYPKNRIKVLLVENIDKRALQIFKNEGYQVEHYDRNLEFKQISQKIEDVSILGIRSRTVVEKDLLNKPKKLISIGAFCIGTDQIDLKACSKSGIVVFNAPYSNSRSVVELVIGEIIMLLRRVFDKSLNAHKGIWAKSAKDSYEARGKKLGIVGYGNIGSQLSVLAENLGMEVYFYDVVDKLPLGNAKKCDSLKELLVKSDVVTIHIDGRMENTNFIAEREFKLMKEGSIFLNLSRGRVVDLNSLAKFIKQGKIRGAAIDVFPNEPKNRDEKFESGLQSLPNVILTPHIGGSTIEAQKNIAEYVSYKIIDHINTGNTYLSVNLPNIQLPKQMRSHRLLHLHKNVPGVLAKIKNIMSENNMNILGQYLKTNEELGYVITDVDRKYSPKVIGELKSIEETIRFRVLY